MKNRIYVENRHLLREYGNPDGDKLTQLNDVLRGLSDSQFTGYIKVNYSQGCIAKVEKFEEILKSSHRREHEGRRGFDR